MSVTGTTQPKTAGRKYWQLRPGLQPWYAAGTATGDVSGGTLNIGIQFNPGQNQSWQPYVVISNAAIKVTTAAPSPAYAVLQNESSQWEQPGGSSDQVVLAPPIELVQVESGGFSGRWDGAANLWRVRKGQIGTITLRLANVNTAVVTARFAGFISKEPIIGDERLRA